MIYNDYHLEGASAIADLIACARYLTLLAFTPAIEIRPLLSK